jgi:predicted DNA-binding protein with PD1-like motif
MGAVSRALANTALVRRAGTPRAHTHVTVGSDSPAARGGVAGTCVGNARAAIRTARTVRASRSDARLGADASGAGRGYPDES